VPDSPVSFLGVRLKLDHIFTLPMTRLLHWRFDHATPYPFPVSGDELKGKRVLVTGGTKGMGQAMVHRLL